jgi:ornithine cyclodeaminase/alanine dehydrogenase-like protein (mu-crystallin family)
VWSALDVIDPVAVLAEDLIGRTVGRSGHTRTAGGRLVTWSGSAPDGGQYVLLEHPEAALPCVMPEDSLRTSLGAALAAVAARELLLSGGVTVAMLCPAEAAEPQLAVIARYVPDISHVALCLVGDSRTVEPKLADLLELSGIGLSVVRTLADAVFGANLVIVTNHNTAAQDPDLPRRGRLARGTVLVNATGTDLPIELVDQVSQVFIDDFGLLEDHLDRRVVADHLAPPAADQPGEFGRRIAADLGQLLTGRQPGRQRTDDVVLVELLGVSELNVELARQIHEGATRTGLGERIDD